MVHPYSSMDTATPLIIINTFILISAVLQIRITNSEIMSYIALSLLGSSRLFNGISSPRGLEENWVHAFRKGISGKVNVIVQSKFKLAYYDVAV